MKRYKNITGTNGAIPGGCSGVINKYRVYLLLSFVFFAAGVFGQSSSTAIKVTLDRDHVLIGEPVDLLVEVMAPPAQPVSAWFNLPDSFNHLEVLSRSALDSVTGAAGLTYRQTITVTGFDPGICTIPAIKIIAGKKTIQSDPLSVTIVPVQLRDSTYHDIREIIDVPQERRTWWYYIAGILSFIVLGILIRGWLRSGRRKPFPGGPVSEVSPLQEALSELRKLSAQQLEHKGEWKVYYSALTDILRRYMERKFQVSAKQKTTGELLLYLKRMDNKAQVSAIAETLRIADAVKFARYRPEIEQANASLQAIEKTIQALDHLKS